MAILKSRDVGDIVVVDFADTKILDEHRILQIGKELLELEAQATVNKKMLVNFQGVEFMSSAMLGQLAKLNKQAKGDNVELKLCCISANVLQVFKMMRLNRIAFATEKKALAAFEKTGWFG